MNGPVHAAAEPPAPIRVHYRLSARHGAETELVCAMRDLAARVEQLDGCGGVELLAQPSEPGTFVFIERWACAQSRDAGGRLLGKQAFAAIAAAVAAKPEQTVFALLPPEKAG